MAREQCYILPYWRNADTPADSKLLMARKALLQTRLGGRTTFVGGAQAGKPVYIVPNYAGQWVLSGGARNWSGRSRRFTETPKQAALREFLEESGVDLSAQKAQERYGATLPEAATRFTDGPRTYWALFVPCSLDGLNKLGSDAKLNLANDRPDDNEMSSFGLFKLAGSNDGVQGVALVGPNPADAQLGPYKKPQNYSWEQMMELLLGFRPQPLNTDLDFAALTQRLETQAGNPWVDWYRTIFAQLRSDLGVD